MQRELKEAIQRYIVKYDRTGDVVQRIAPSRDWSTGEVHYNWKNLSRGRECGRWDDASEKSAEELVRAYLLVRLTKELGYPLDKSITVEESYSIGHPSKKNAYLDVRVADKRDVVEKSFLLIECKSPEKYEGERTDAIENQLFKLAPQEQHTNGRPVRYLGYYTVRLVEGQIVEEVEVIDFEQFKNWDDWDKANQPPAARSIPASYAVATVSRFVNKQLNKLKDGERALDKSKDRDFFGRLQKDLHNKLWGGATEYNYIFKNLSRLFLAKIYDEHITEPGKEYRFQVRQKIDPGQRVPLPRNETPQELFLRINELVQESTSLLGYTDEERARYTIEEDYVDANKVAYVVTQLEAISVIENIHAKTGDILGDFFEGIVSEGFKQSAGTFFTHKNIVYFLLYGMCLDELVTEQATNPVDPRLPFICDPSCGSGTFLIEAMRFVTQHLPDKASQPLKVQKELSGFTRDDSPHAWAERFIYGADNNADLALSTKVNMVLHRDGNLHIFRGDGLKKFAKFPQQPAPNSKNIPTVLNTHSEDATAPYPYEVNEQFDVVISNPPFAVPLDPQTRKEHKGRFLFAQTKNSEVLFIERYYQLMRPNGRMGVVLPESIFDTAENLSIRLFIYRHFEIKGIVSLPPLAFNPFTSTKTCLLFARKKTRPEIEAFDNRWREAAKNYVKLRAHRLILWAIQNKELHDRLLSLCANTGHTYQPLRNLLHPDNLSPGFDGGLKKAVVAAGIAEKRATTLLERIDQHFGEAPFPDIRHRSKAWQDANVELLGELQQLAEKLGKKFKPDADGWLSASVFTTAVQDALTQAATTADKGKNGKQSKAWAKLRTVVTKYLDAERLDFTTDVDTQQVVLRFLGTMLDPRDAKLPTLLIVDKYLDDIAAIGEINDKVGQFPKNYAGLPYGHANAWWVFGEVANLPGIEHDMFMAEVEEIGYKRGKGNRYQPRPNQLFACTDANDLLASMQADDPETVLGRLRAHWRKKKVSETGLLGGGFVTALKCAGLQLPLRVDPKYRFFWDRKQGWPYTSNRADGMPLREALLPFTPRQVKKGKLASPRTLVELADVEARTSILLEPEDGEDRSVVEVGSSKTDFGSCDLVVNRLRPYLGKVILNDPDDPVIGTSEWIPFKLRKDAAEPHFTKYLLLLPQMLEAHRCLMGGKQHPRTREEDLKRLTLPIPPLARQTAALPGLKRLEKEMVHLHRTLATRADAIDAIFAEEFGYTLDDFKVEAKRLDYEVPLSHIGGGIELRGGVRHQHPKYDVLEAHFASATRRPFREVVRRPVRLGATINPKTQYDDTGEALYISAAVIKTNIFNFDVAQPVTQAYFYQNARSFALQEDDVVIARSGEGTIGKAAIFREDRPCIHSDFTMRVRFNERILPEYGYHFCCSRLFQAQVEKAKRGMGNMTNFFPSQLMTCWILTPDLERQRVIAKRIGKALDSLEAQRTAIQRLRSEIDDLILAAATAV